MKIKLNIYYRTGVKRPRNKNTTNIILFVNFKSDIFNNSKDSINEKRITKISEWDTIRNYYVV